MSTVIDVNGINVIYDVNDSTEFDSLTYMRTKDEIPVVPNSVKQTCGKVNDARFKCDLTFYEVNGKRWVKAADVVNALRYSNPNQFIRESIPNEFKIIIGNRARGAVLLSIAGVYCAIFKSQMKIAEDYRRWVFTEVLPSIHATGKYDISESNSELANSVGVKEMDALTKHMLNIEEKVQSAIEQKGNNLPNVDFHVDETVLSESAKVVRAEFNLLLEGMVQLQNTVQGMTSELSCDVMYGIYGDTLKELGRRHKKEVVTTAIHTLGNVNVIGEVYIPNGWGTPKDVAEYIRNCTAKPCSAQDVNTFLCEVGYQVEVNKGSYAPDVVAKAKKCVTNLANTPTLIWNKDIVFDLWKEFHPYCQSRNVGKQKI